MGEAKLRKAAAAAEFERLGVVGQELTSASAETIYGPRGAEFARRYRALIDEFSVPMVVTYVVMPNGQRGILSASGGDRYKQAAEEVGKALSAWLIERNTAAGPRRSTPGAGRA